MKNHTWAEAHMSYNEKTKIHADGFIEVKKYNKVIHKKLDGFEERKEENEKQKRIQNKKKRNSKNDIRGDSLSRTRNTLYDYVCFNSCWHSFITLTFANDIRDISLANRLFNSFVGQVKRTYVDFKAIGVPEFQKNGRVHYHLLTNIKCDSDLIPKRKLKKLYNKSTNQWQELEYYDFKYWNYGYSLAYDLEQTDDMFRPELYILKYLYKDVDQRLWGRKKVIRIGRLEKPKIEYTTDKYILDDVEPNYTYESDKAVVPSFAIYHLNIKEQNNEN